MGQLVQTNDEVAPTVDEYWPAAQRLHDGAPDDEPKVPAGQSCPASCEQSNGAVLTLSAATALSATCTTGPHASTAPPQGWHTETG